MNPCVFDPDVLCAFTKGAKSYVIERCFSCQHYLAFAEGMEREEAEFWEEEEKIRKYGYPKRFDVSKGGS